MSNDGTSMIVIESEASQPEINRDTIRKLLDDGLTVQVIAAQLRLDPSRVMEAANDSRALARQVADNGERLKGLLNSLEEIIDIAHWQAKAEPTPFNIGAYTQAIDTARGLMQDIDGRRDNQKLASEVIKRVLEPLTKQCMLVMMQRLSSVRTELEKQTQPELHPEIEHQMKQVILALGSVLSDQLVASKETLDSVLNDKADPKPRKAKEGK